MYSLCCYYTVEGVLSLLLLHCLWCTVFFYLLCLGCTIFVVITLFRVYCLFYLLCLGCTAFVVITQFRVYCLFLSTLLRANCLFCYYSAYGILSLFLFTLCTVFFIYSAQCILALFYLLCLGCAVCVVIFCTSQFLILQLSVMQHWS